MIGANRNGFTSTEVFSKDCTIKPLNKSCTSHLPICTEEIVLIVPFNHRFANRQTIPLSEVANEPFIHFKKGHSFREDTDELCQNAGFTPNIIYETDDSKIITELVKSGMGVAFWLESLLEKENSFHHLGISEPICQRTYQLAWSEKRYLSLAARTFRDLLIQQFTE